MKKQYFAVVSVALAFVANSSFADVTDAQLTQLRDSTLTCSLVKVTSNLSGANATYVPAAERKLVSYIQHGDATQGIPDQFCLSIPSSDQDQYGGALGGYSCFNIWHSHSGFQGSVDQFDARGLMLDMGVDGSTDLMSINLTTGEGEIKLHQHYGWNLFTFDTADATLQDCVVSDATPPTVR
jgi:hypothetical protein